MSGSYQVGQAPPDAPWTWHYGFCNPNDIVVCDRDERNKITLAVFGDEDKADAVCQAFHDSARRLKIIKEYVAALSSDDLIRSRTLAATDDMANAYKRVGDALTALRAESLP